MMNGTYLNSLYEWIRNLTGYLIFLAVLDQLLLEKENGKYVRLFAGMVLILLMIQPLAGAEKLTNQAARMYEELELRYDTAHLKEEILGVEKRQYDRLLRQYEKAAEQEVLRLALEDGYREAECQAVICREEENEKFGAVTAIRLTLQPVSGKTGSDCLELRKRIAAYYRLEEDHVEIQMLKGEG